MGRRGGSLDGEGARSDLLPMLISEKYLGFPPVVSCFLLPTKQQQEACEKLTVGNAV